MTDPAAQGGKVRKDMEGGAGDESRHMGKENLHNKRARLLREAILTEARKHVVQAPCEGLRTHTGTTKIGDGDLRTQ